MTTRCRITVAMPAFNVAPVVAEAIESVLAQSVQDFELIVIDDASTDATGEQLARFAKHPRVRIFRNETNLGSGATRSRILAHAAGEYWVPCDADDLLLPGALATLGGFLDRTHDVGAVYGDVLRMDTAGMRLLAVPTVIGSDANTVWDLYENAVNHGGSMIRTDLVRRIGGYSAHAAPDDWDLFLKLREIARIHYLKGHLFYIWRVRPESQSRVPIDPSGIIRAAIARRRLQRSGEP